MICSVLSVFCPVTCLLLRYNIAYTKCSITMKHLKIITVGGGIGGLCLAQNNSIPQKDLKVIMTGGGMGGLCFARELKDERRGFEPFEKERNNKC
jgi:NADH dehydrogenase FAD-containing subunit